MQDERVKHINQSLTPRTVLLEGQIPSSPSEEIQAINSIRSAQAIRSHSQSEVHLPAEDFKEGNSRPIRQGLKRIARNANAPSSSHAANRLQSRTKPCRKTATSLLPLERRCGFSSCRFCE